MERRVVVPAAPQRIISLVPSITELLYDLGLGNRVVGVTRFCLHPREARQNCTNVGGTKQLHLSRIAELKPDLIIANKEENTRSEIEKLAENHAVWVSDVNTVAEGVDMIRRIGQLCQKQVAAEQMAQKIEAEFASLQPVAQQKIKVAYLIWKDPIMGCGNQNFIHDIIMHCGWENVLADISPETGSRYPEVSADTLRELAPDFLLLSSEPYPFAEKHRVAFNALLPHTTSVLVDGELFSWYGSRMLQMPIYLRSLQKQLIAARHVE